MAQLATGNRDDALEIVQDAMFKLAEKYANKPETEWDPLFKSILQSRINDWYRRSSVRNRFRVWLGMEQDDNAVDSFQAVNDRQAATPEDLLQSSRRIDRLEEALGRLSFRQRQAFLLRNWEGLDVRQTARAMSCSEGTVKTHYSRAVHLLREQLEDHW